MEHLAYGMNSSVTVSSYVELAKTADATKLGAVDTQHDLLHTALHGHQVQQDTGQHYTAVMSRQTHVQDSRLRAYFTPLRI